VASIGVLPGTLVSVGVLPGTLVSVGVLPGTLVSVGVLPGTLVCTSVLPGAVVCTLALVLAGDYCIPAVLAPDGARTWTIAVVLATVTPAFRVGHHGHDGHEQPGAGQGRQRIMLTALTGRIRCQRGQHRWISGPVVGRELRFCHIQPAHGPTLDDWFGHIRTPALSVPGPTVRVTFRGQQEAGSRCSTPLPLRMWALQAK
jgi:hypothetical protein